MLSAFSYSYIKMKVGGAEYVRKKSLEAINAATGFARVLQPYETPKLLNNKVIIMKTLLENVGHCFPTLISLYILKVLT
jgi:hypothetical protein